MSMLDAIPARSIISLLEFDADLGVGIAPDELPAAIVASRAEIVHLPRGDWDPESTARHDGLGAMVLTGMLARTVRVGRRASLELLVPGDLIRPWQDERSELLVSTTSWEVLSRASTATLDERFLRAVRPWPQINTALAGRAMRRSRWLAVQAAIDAHPTVEDRLMLLFCHLAERTGKIGPEGVTLDLPLSHRLMANTVRALRPSVTSGLLLLREDDRLLNPSRRRWIITRRGLQYAAELCRQDADAA